MPAFLPHARLFTHPPVPIKETSMQSPETGSAKMVLYETGRSAALASPASMGARSRLCDIQMPTSHLKISPQEEAFPLVGSLSLECLIPTFKAFYVTAYTDARALEVLLSVIFYPHNSYCIHLDPKVAQSSNVCVCGVVNHGTQLVPSTVYTLTSRLHCSFVLLWYLASSPVTPNVNPTPPNHSSVRVTGQRS